MSLPRSKSVQYIASSPSQYYADSDSSKSYLDDVERARRRGASVRRKLHMTSLTTSRTGGSTAPATTTPITSPFLEREDPFSLAGFFSSHRTASMDNFEWCPRIEADERDERDESRVESPDEDVFPSTPGSTMSMFGDKEEALTRKVIDTEDKLGLLSIETYSKALSAVFSDASPPPADDRILSPYSDEEPVDQESLYSKLCARREAETRVRSHSAAQLSAGDRLGLFSPDAQVVAKDDAATSGGWSAPLYRRVQDLVDSL